MGSQVTRRSTCKPSKICISASDNTRPQISIFSSILDGLVLLGIVTTLCCTLQRISICAAVFPYLPVCIKTRKAKPFSSYLLNSLQYLVRILHTCLLWRQSPGDVVLGFWQVGNNLLRQYHLLGNSRPIFVDFGAGYTQSK